MEKIEILDLHFQDAESTIGSFLISGPDGPVLVETGPESTWPHLKAGLKTHGFEPEDIRAVLLTHIHFDHAGAAWRLAEAGTDIYVHPLGLPHLANPERLWRSAAQIYGEEMDRLWGKMAPIPSGQLKAPGDKEILRVGGMDFRAWYTPGHAVHHIAWQLDDILFTGDVAGVKIGSGPVVPPCPPPDIHLEDWKKSLELIGKINPKALYLTHYGVVEDISTHLQNLRIIMDDWAKWMKKQYDLRTPVEDIIPQFMAYTEMQMKEKGVDGELNALYEHANPSWMSVNGLLRYWKLKDQGRIP
ncbi:MBL fold metallo-hydrolase [Negadavirga shengliensis]|uniref:MBL fold metallo-hydrolase n=1 Tax=Negadavirga shengliensis TaxID=1389218 RepID=A0ABV9T360_9BACT